MEWQPIDTAPKDGRTEILSYRKAGLISVVVWDEINNSWCVTDGMYVINVTHWMPLPEPPKE